MCGRARGLAGRCSRLLLALAVMSAAGCRSRDDAPRALGEFTAEVDVQAGTVALRAAAPTPSGVVALLDLPVGPGAGQVQLVTEWTGAVAPDGHVTGHDCGSRGSFCMAMTVRSLYTAELHDVYVEAVAIAPPIGRLAVGSTATPTASEPGAGEVSSRLGLWRYPALLDRARGETIGQTFGANAATRVWTFDARSAEPFRLRLRVMARQVTPAATGLAATCAGAPTSLATTSDCGECGRTAPDATACSYGTTHGTLTGGASGLDFQVACATGRTACDSGDASAFACLDLASDPANCGACGHDCGGLTCSDGLCGARCATGESACTVGGSAMCCPAGSSCSVGQCVLTDALEVTVGRNRACAATLSARPAPPSAGSPAPTTSNNVLCWGTGYYGDLSSRSAAVIPEFRPVSSGNTLGYQLRPDQRSLSCGDDLCVATSASFFLDAAYAARAFGAAGNFVNGWNTQATQMTWGGHHGCGNYGRGIYCWGLNEEGQIGNNHRLDPVSGLPWDCTYEQQQECMVTDLTGAPWTGPDTGLVATQVSAGGDTTCAVLDQKLGQTAGTVACWGDNAEGRAGGAAATSAFAYPHLVAGVAHAIAVSVGGRHSAAIVDGGTHLVLWGRNAEGELGNGTSTSTPGTVVTITPPARVTSVAAGQDFTCYAAAGRVYCAGTNDRGQLGDGTTHGRNTFAPVLGVYGATAVSAGGVPGGGGTPLGSACALAGGQVVCWGDNSSGQVGAGLMEPWIAIPQSVVLAPDPPQEAGALPPAARAHVPGHSELQP